MIVGFSLKTLEAKNNPSTDRKEMSARKLRLVKIFRNDGEITRLWDDITLKEFVFEDPIYRTAKGISQRKS
jgi:hypothetical protein